MYETTKGFHRATSHKSLNCYKQKPQLKRRVKSTERDFTKEKNQTGPNHMHKEK